MEDEISEPSKDPFDRLDDERQEEEEAVPGKRGAKKIPQQWTRVISLSTDNLQALDIYPIADDLDLNTGYK